MSKPLILILEWLPEGVLDRLVQQFPECALVDARAPDVRARLLPEAAATYGSPPLDKMPAAARLRWIQLISAGVPQDLCPVAAKQNVTVTNLAGLYGPTIADHAIALTLILSRNLHLAARNQAARLWDRTIMHHMQDLHGKTLAVIGLGNIGQNIARLARAHGMRVVGCRRTPRPTPYVDRLYPSADLHAMLAEAEYVAVGLPLTAQTEGMLGPAEFAAMKKGTIYINVSRGGVAQEHALLEALRSGHLAGAGLDVYAVEPLPADHPLWTMPQVVISPHVSGETVNQSALPSERFLRNLASWLGGEEMEGRVNLDCGY